MNTVRIVLLILTGLAFFTTIVCGLWLRFSGEEVTAGALNFHLLAALASVTLTAATLVVVMRAA